MLDANLAVWAFALTASIVMIGKAELPHLAPLILIVLMGLATLVFQRDGRCPRCDNGLGALQRLPKAGMLRLSAAVRFCPYCGLSLDAELGDTQANDLDAGASTQGEPLASTLTIREHLSAKLRQAHVVGIAPFGLVVFVMFAYAPLLEIAVPVLLLVVIGAGLYSNRAVRCPRCAHAIGGMAGMPKGGRVGLAAALRFCPFCGLSLDTELRAARTTNRRTTAA